MRKVVISSSSICRRAARSIRMRRGRGCKGAACAESCIEQHGAATAQDPGLRKQRALGGFLGGFIGSGKQAFPQGRNDFLTGDGAGLPASFRQDSPIALACGLRIAFGTDLSDRFDSRGELADVVAALLAITIEQGFASLPMKDVIDFQTRFALSRRPWHMPFPMKGGC